MTYVKVCSLSVLRKGEMRRVWDAPPVAVYNVDGEIYATSDICTHGQFVLSDGYLKGDRVECALHFAQFCIRTGEVLAPPATEPIETYAVEVRGGDVYVDIVAASQRV